MYNRVILMGRLTRDPELRTTQSGIQMCRFSIAVDRQFAKQGEEKQADFFDVTVWRNTAEFVSKYFSKGRMIHLEGRLQNNNYTDQNGVKHYAMAIIADHVTFCGDKSGTQGQPDYKPSQAGMPQSSSAPTSADVGVDLGDLSDFEEILSDREVPF
jgi:single-strand DNA-binding protein